MQRKYIYFILLFLPVFLLACAVTDIPLKSLPFSAGDVPTVSAKTAVIVTFTDARGINVIGFTEAGKEIKIQGNITEWATKVLATLLQKEGFRISLAKTMEEAQSLSPHIIITGKIEKLTLESTAFSSTASIMLRTATTQPNGKTTDLLSGKVSAVNNPFSDTEATILLEVLQQAYSNYISELLKK